MRVPSLGSVSSCSVVQPKETWPRLDKLGWWCVCVRACVCVVVIEEHQCTGNVWRQTVLFSVLYVALLCFYRTDNGAYRIKTQVSV